MAYNVSGLALVQELEVQQYLITTNVYNMTKRGRKPQEPALKQALVSRRFNSVKELMEDGYPKYIACKKAGVSRSWLHNNLSAEQNRILDEIYFSFSNGSSATKWKVENGG